MWNKMFLDPVEMTRGVEAVERKVCFVLFRSLFYPLWLVLRSCIYLPGGNLRGSQLKRSNDYPVIGMSVPHLIRTAALDQR
ncbi:hypothetical protein C8R48DRAFT_740228 [Suillus tomentosus]|nr:hypothetical protein C8R48DRAFT_740228 [Suillus tomentosus]